MNHDLLWLVYNKNGINNWVLLTGAFKTIVKEIFIAFTLWIIVKF